MRHDTSSTERQALHATAVRRAHQLRCETELALWRRWTAWWRATLQRLSLEALPEA
jgi:hypothetical protein